MKLLALIKPIVSFGLSAAGLALDHQWPSGLKNAGWSIYLVLMPFMNYPALLKLSTKLLAVADATDPSLSLLPGMLGLIGLLGLMLLLAGSSISVMG